MQILHKFWDLDPLQCSQLLSIENDIIFTITFYLSRMPNPLLSHFYENEITLGLEESGVKFLWALRKPLSEGKISPPSDFTYPQEILSKGFLTRIGARGLVCGWAPQAEILAHRAIRGFVSHCGWNSILEALWFGVPIAAWPMYAEQKANVFYLVEDLKLVMGLKMNYSLGQTDLVNAREIQNAVELLMNDTDDEISKMRARV
uniref:UDP-glycosyltransferases domain-containing protein n=1 Tax=Kalanchoe fedtschenkoi TaxID=63787 RepID=A0A7N0RGB9_KALFE